MDRTGNSGEELRGGGGGEPLGYAAAVGEAKGGNEE
jgi:hypothetical protein